MPAQGLRGICAPAPRLRDWPRAPLRRRPLPAAARPRGSLAAVRSRSGLRRWPPQVAGLGPALPAPLTLALSRRGPGQTGGGERAVPMPLRAGVRAGAGQDSLPPQGAAGEGEGRARRFLWV